MNQPWIYMCSPSWSPLLPPSPSDPSWFSQCTSPEHLSHASSLNFKHTLFLLSLQPVSYSISRIVFVSKCITLAPFHSPCQCPRSCPSHSMLRALPSCPAGLPHLLIPPLSCSQHLASGLTPVQAHSSVVSSLLESKASTLPKYNRVFWPRTQHPHLQLPFPPWAVFTHLLKLNMPSEAHLHVLSSLKCFLITLHLLPSINIHDATASCMWMLFRIYIFDYSQKRCCWTRSSWSQD